MCHITFIYEIYRISIISDNFAQKMPSSDNDKSKITLSDNDKNLSIDNYRR